MGIEIVTDVRANQPVYGARVERKFALPEHMVDDVLGELSAQLPRDPMYPTPQPVRTTYLRSIDEGGPKGKIRVRTYPASETPPTFLEFKTGKGALREKVRIPVDADFVPRLLAGDHADDAVGLVQRGGDELPTAQRAVDLIDRGMQPVVEVNYMRQAFEDAAGTIRVTIDRGLEHHGIGRLAGASGTRPGAVLEIKSAGGAAPAWLESMLNDLVGSGVGVTELADGKGSAALEDVMRGVAKLVR